MLLIFPKQIKTRACSHLQYYKLHNPPYLITSNMSLRQMIEFWKEGVELGEKDRYEDAIKKFLDMPEPGARIYFNIASMYLRLGKLEEANKVRL